MKEVYYDIVNFIQEMPAIWFATICLIGFACSLALIVKFYKVYNGSQKSFEKLGSLVLALVIFSLLVFLTYVRK